MRATAQVYRYRDIAMVVCIAAIFILAVVYSVFSATTIGDNISTGGTLTVSGVSSVSHLYASSTVQATLNGLFYANVGVGGTTSPGAALAVSGAGLFTATSTIVGGGLITEGITAADTIGFYTRGTAAPRMVVGLGGGTNVGIATSSPGALFSVGGAGLFTATSTIVGGGLITEGITAPNTIGFYTRGTAAPRMVVGLGGGTNVGIATSSPGALFSVAGAGLFTATSTVLGGGLITEGVTAPGILGFYTRGTDAPRLVIDSSGNLGVATSGPGALLSVAGAGLFTATSTIVGGGLITEGVTAPGILGFYTRGTAAPRLVIDGSGNLGVATSGPTTTFSTTGSGYFTGGLGVGYATTGSGNLLVNDLAVIKGRLGVIGSTTPYQEVGVTGDGVFGGAIGTSSLSVETSTANRNSCIELRDNAGARWIRIYPGSGAGNSSAAFIASTTAANGNGTGLLVIEPGRCEEGTD